MYDEAVATNVKALIEKAANAEKCYEAKDFAKAALAAASAAAVLATVEAQSKHQ